jgi:hypothetical protein
MTIEEQRRLWELVQNPPAGSKISAAKEYGIDLTLCLESLTMTPTERLSAMQNMLRLVEELERANSVKADNNGF